MAISAREVTYEKSRKMYEDACQVIAGGVNSDMRRIATPVPLFFARASGAYLYDVDGRRYIDYVEGMGPNVLGHGHPAVSNAIRSALDDGQLYAGQHPAEIRLARTLCDLVPAAELVRFGLTGSEALQAAFRVARALTGRRKIVKFEGHYHGWFDNIFFSYRPPIEIAGPADDPVAVPMGEGLASTAHQDVIVLPFNNIDAVTGALEARGDEIAAVVLEPINCNTSVITPREGYLETLRAVCTRYGVILIFDEVVTGFRLALGGAQELLGVTPDLAVFAKAFANGVPAACVVGRRDMMQPMVEGRVKYQGTYNSNVLSTVAAQATLDELARDGGAAVKRMHAIGQSIMAGLEEAAREVAVPFLVQGYGPVFHTAFVEGEPFTDYRDYVTRQNQPALEHFIARLQDRGVRVTYRGTWLPSASHSEKDVGETIDAARETFIEMRDMGLFDSRSPDGRR